MRRVLCSHPGLSLSTLGVPVPVIWLANTGVDCVGSLLGVIISHSLSWGKKWIDETKNHNKRTVISKRKNE